MELIITIFNETLARPLFNLLVWVYNVVPGQDFGIAIIIVTIFLRVLLYPLSDKALKSQKILQELQPKIKELQKKYKNKEEQAKKMMEFYKEHKINPLSGCLPILVQLPLLIALYRVFLTGLDPESLNNLYSFVGNPGELNPIFIGMLNLSEPSHLLAIMAGAAQYFQAKSAFKQRKDIPKPTTPSCPRDRVTNPIAIRAKALPIMRPKYEMRVLRAIFCNN